jgi:hypothetical protein
MTAKQDWLGKPLKIIQKTPTDKKEYRLHILKSCNYSIVLFIFFRTFAGRFAIFSILRNQGIDLKQMGQKG